MNKANKARWAMLVLMQIAGATPIGLTILKVLMNPSMSGFCGVRLRSQRLGDVELGFSGYADFVASSDPRFR